jgi:hypothetical protein
MGTLMANYAFDSDSDNGGPAPVPDPPVLPKTSALLPPLPLDLLQPLDFVGMIPSSSCSIVTVFQGITCCRLLGDAARNSRQELSPIEGNYAVHV